MALFSEDFLENISECYRILDLAPGSSLDQIKTSYRELVKVWHPDRFAHDPKLQAKAQEKLKQINSAYECLCREKSRTSYNASAAKSTAPPHPSQQSRSAPNWGSSDHPNDSQQERSRPNDPPPQQSKLPKNQELVNLVGIIAGILVLGVWFNYLSKSGSQPGQPAQSTGPVVDRPPPPARERLGIEQIISLHEEAKKKWPDVKMSVPEFSRWAQAKAPAFDFSAGFDFTPPLTAPEPMQASPATLSVQPARVESTVAAKLVSPPSSTAQAASPKDKPTAFVGKAENQPAIDTNPNASVNSDTAEVPANVQTRETVTRITKSGSPILQQRESRSFTQGSSKDDVIRVQGTPDGIDRYDSIGYEVWHYGYATVEISIRDGRVRKWSNSEGRLKVSMVPGPDATAATTFSQGSSKDDVIRLQGTPDGIDRYDSIGYEVWHYGSATVEISIREGRVRKWSNSEGRLKVSMVPGPDATAATTFSQGSSKDDVIRLQGTPDGIDRYDSIGYEVWHYGSATVEISIREGRVRKWSNSEGRLKVSMKPTDNDPI